MSKFGRSIDKFEIDLFKSRTSGGYMESLTKSDDSFLDTRAAAFDEDEIFINDTIMRKATHGGDTFFGKIKLSRGRGLIRSSSQTINLLVGFGTMMEAILTSTRD